MLLLFRFLLTIVPARLRSRIGPFDESRISFTVLPNDCDLNVHLNAGRFVSFMDIARIELLARMRLFLPLVRRRWQPVMGGSIIRFRRSILPFERFSIRSRILGWDEKWFYVDQIVERDGAMCAAGVMRMLVRSKEGNITPRDLFALLGQGELVSPPLPDFVVRWEDGR